MKNALFHRLFALVLAALLCGVPLAAAPSPPSPTDEFYVGDFAGVLSDGVEQHIIEQNLALCDATGAQIVVVTVDFLDGYDIDDYAYTLFNEWEIGSSEYNNGYLILLAISDENYYSMPGAGLESLLDGGAIDDLQWNYLEDGFAAGDYDRGVRAYFDAVYERVADHYDFSPASPGTSSAAAGISGSIAHSSSPSQPEPQPEPEPSFGGGFSLAGMVGGVFSMVRRVITFGVGLIVVLALFFVFSGSRSIYRGGSRPRYYGGLFRRTPRRPPPPPPPPPPPRGGGFGGFGGFGSGGSRPRSGGMGGFSRGGGASRRSGGFSGSRSSSSRSSFGGSRGGGGRSRGGGAGRRR